MAQQDRNAIRERLFDALDETRVGMLGIDDSGQHMQPMTHFLDRDDDSLWFISGTDTDLVRTLSSGARRAHFTLQDKGELYACLSGALSHVEDRGKLDELWSPAASMWFDGGKDDPRVALLRMPIAEAAIWTIDAGRLAFGIEMARGAMGDHDPDVGDHVVLSFPVAA
jgi:general stress protein 26